MMNTNYITISAILVGLLQVFFGYKLKKLWIAIHGFFFGLIAGGALGGLTRDGKLAIALTVAIICAVLGAWVAYRFYKIGIFLLCFGGTFLASIIVCTVVAGDGGLGQGLWISLFLGIVAGVLGMALTKPMFIITTAVSGGMSCGASVRSLTGWSVAGICIALVLIAAGLWYQIKSNNGLLEKQQKNT